MAIDPTKPVRSETDGEAMFHSIRAVVDLGNMMDLADIFVSNDYRILSSYVKQILSLVALEFRRRCPR